MEGGIPVVDRSVVFAKRNLEVVIGVVANDDALHLDRVLVRPCRETQFAKGADFRRERRAHVQDHLAEVEAAGLSFSVGGGKINVGEASNLERWIDLFGGRSL